MTPNLPPRWFIRAAWVGHRTVYRLTGGRRGLATPTAGGRFGLLRLQTTGRRTGEPRVAILGYVEDGQNLVTLAMNGWADRAPAWWVNLQAAPDAVVDLKAGRRRPVRARAAAGEERARLWALVATFAGYGDLDAFAAARAGETAVVVLEPRAAAIA
jgi:deazaflavin-dependent oxidoreductase (nitroreductase family)